MNIDESFWRILRIYWELFMGIGHGLRFTGNINRWYGNWI